MSENSKNKNTPLILIIILLILLICFLVSYMIYNSSSHNTNAENSTNRDVQGNNDIVSTADNGISSSEIFEEIGNFNILNNYEFQEKSFDNIKLGNNNVNIKISGRLMNGNKDTEIKLTINDKTIDINKSGVSRVNLYSINGYLVLNYGGCCSDIELEMYDFEGNFIDRINYVDKKRGLISEKNLKIVDDLGIAGIHVIGMSEEQLYLPFYLSLVVDAPDSEGAIGVESLNNYCSNTYDKLEIEYKINVLETGFELKEISRECQKTHQLHE